MILVTSIIAVLGMILLPILLGFWLTRKFKLSWKLFFAGALTFIAAGVAHPVRASVDGHVQKWDSAHPARSVEHDLQRGPARTAGRYLRRDGALHPVQVFPQERADVE